METERWETHISKTHGSQGFTRPLFAQHAILTCSWQANCPIWLAIQLSQLFVTWPAQKGKCAKPRFTWVHRPLKTVQLTMLRSSPIL